MAPVKRRRRTVAAKPVPALAPLAAALPDVAVPAIAPVQPQLSEHEAIGNGPSDSADHAGDGATGGRDVTAEFVPVDRVASDRASGDHAPCCGEARPQGRSRACAPICSDGSRPGCAARREASQIRRGDFAWHACRSSWPGLTRCIHVFACAVVQERGLPATSAGHADWPAARSRALRRAERDAKRETYRFPLLRRLVFAAAADASAALPGSAIRPDASRAHSVVAGPAAGWLRCRLPAGWLAGCSAAGGCALVRWPGAPRAAIGRRVRCSVALALPVADWRRGGCPLRQSVRAVGLICGRRRVATAVGAAQRALFGDDLAADRSARHAPGARCPGRAAPAAARSPAAPRSGRRRRGGS